MEFEVRAFAKDKDASEISLGGQLLNMHAIQRFLQLLRISHLGSNPGTVLISVLDHSIISATTPGRPDSRNICGRAGYGEATLQICTVHLADCLQGGMG